MFGCGFVGVHDRVRGWCSGPGLVFRSVQVCTRVPVSVNVGDGFSFQIRVEESLRVGV